MTFRELIDQIALDVWKIQCADHMIAVDEAARRWSAMLRTGSNPRLEIEHIVGCALIALKNRGLIEYDAKLPNEVSG